MDNTIKRRLFLRGAFATAALVCLKRLPASEKMINDYLDRQYYINPAYTSYFTDMGELILQTTLPGGKTRFTKCHGLEMELLLLIKDHKTISPYVPGLAAKHMIPEQEVASRCNSYIDRLYREGVIIDGKSKINIVQNANGNSIKQ